MYMFKYLSLFRSDLWMCNLCGKAFESHEYLDMHMENKHKDRMHIVSEINHNKSFPKEKSVYKVNPTRTRTRSAWPTTVIYSAAAATCRTTSPPSPPPPRTTPTRTTTSTSSAPSTRTSTPSASTTAARASWPRRRLLTSSRCSRPKSRRGGLPCSKRAWKVR